MTAPITSARRRAAATPTPPCLPGVPWALLATSGFCHALYKAARGTSPAPSRPASAQARARCCRPRVVPRPRPRSVRRPCRRRRRRATAVSIAARIATARADAGRRAVGCAGRTLSAAAVTAAVVVATEASTSEAATAAVTAAAAMVTAAAVIRLDDSGSVGLWEAAMVTAALDGDGVAAMAMALRWQRHVAAHHSAATSASVAPALG